MNLNGSIENIKLLLDKIIEIPALWIILVCILTLASTLRIEDLCAVFISGNLDSLKIHFEITSITVILLITIWIPCLLKLIGLLGGGIKVNNTEFSTTGLIKSLTDLIGAIDIIEPSLDPTQGDDVKLIRDNAERELATTFTQNINNARAQMLKLSSDYESIRKNMSPSKERTAMQGNIFTQMRVHCSIIRYSKSEIKDFLESKSLGNRIIGLAAVQIDLDFQFFSQIIQIIEKSTVPYEQYQAIRVLENFIQYLNKDQCALVRKVLNYQRSGHKGTIINVKDQGRWNRSSKILDLIEKKIEE